MASKMTNGMMSVSAVKAVLAMESPKRKQYFMINAICYGVIAFTFSVLYLVRAGSVGNI